MSHSLRVSPGLEAAAQLKLVDRKNTQELLSLICALAASQWQQQAVFTKAAHELATGAIAASTSLDVAAWKSLDAELNAHLHPNEPSR